MTSKEFVLWLKGFTQGVHEFNITPKQWDLLKDKLAEVKDDSTISPFPFGVPNSSPNTQTFPKWQEPHKVNPFYVGDVPLTNPVGDSGTTSTPGFAVTTTPGYGTLKYDPSTTTRWNPSGSTWSYTNSTYRPPYTTGGPDEVIKKEENEN